jgi:hypothetical protein
MNSKVSSTLRLPQGRVHYLPSSQCSDSGSSGDVFLVYYPVQRPLSSIQVTGSQPLKNDGRIHPFMSTFEQVINEVSLLKLRGIY